MDPVPVSPPLQCEHNCFLMDIAIQQPYSDMYMQVLNACRLYLGVTLLSDITTANGQGLAPFSTAWQKPSFSKVKGLLPYQDHPNQQESHQWDFL